jgi:fructose-bisphosphate aldolase class II
VELTAEIHKHLAPYGTSGAQHGTSGNSSERLRAIAKQTNTTKANVATALQMVSWGLEVNDYGNAILDDDGKLKKVKGEGMSEEMWQQMVAYADAKGWKSGDYKQLNLPFETRLMGQPRAIRERMAKRVEDFVFTMLTEVFYAGGSGTLSREVILEAGSYDLGPKVGRIEDPAGWTREMIVERAKSLDVNKGPAGNFDD